MSKTYTQKSKAFTNDLSNSQQLIGIILAFLTLLTGGSLLIYIYIYERWNIFPLSYHMGLPYLVLQSRIVFGV